MSARMITASLAALTLLGGCASTGWMTPPAAPVEMAAPADDGIVAGLMTDNRVQTAFAEIEAMRTLNNERLVELTQIPAPPFAEQARGAEMAARMRALGLADVTIDAVGNVIGRRPGTAGSEARSIAIVAHLDTVFPEGTDVTVHREGDLFTAPGIGDNSRGLVVLLSLIDTMQRAGIETRDDLVFIASVGEEGLGDLRGVRHLYENDASPFASFIAIDGGDAARLVVTAVGSIRYRVTFRGPGGHSYGHFGRVQPHQALAEAILRFTEAATPLTLDGTKATFSFGRVGGGTSVNSIPFESWMEVDMRSANPQKLDALHQAFLGSVDAALEAANARRRQGDALTVDLDPVGSRPPGEGDLNAPIVLHAMAAIRAMGQEPELTASSTDANIPISRGVPSVTMSRGGISRNAHAPNESWLDENAHEAIQMALLVALAEAGLVSGE
ncbi:M20/M25/M40 family metallo-hydrolase [uncultured Maricaulis sp.]|uniref:M20/M25/M40 family metallo-hydrolase n=1 Tax=uncultured Maricaulis sp. TaxID=174710 RepID=UPI0030D7D3F8